MRPFSTAMSRFLFVAPLCWLVLTAGDAKAHGETLPRHALNLVLPGHSSESVDTLDDKFQARVQKVVYALHRKGFTPKVRSAYRSSRRQDLIYGASRVGTFFGRSSWTQVKGGHSCHNVSDDGEGAALAIDITDPNATTLKARARFYKALGREAKKQRLRWGGDWKRSNKVWAKYGLGWDPGHIESRRCQRALRAQRRAAR